MLHNIPLFSDLDEAELATLTEKAVTRQYQRHTIIINEGDNSDSLYIINSGRVKIILGDEEGKEVILNTQGEGEYFGELALLDPAPRSASVMTTEKCSLTMISKTDFDDFLEKHPEANLKIMRNIIKRLRLLSEDVKSLALMDVYGRVARVLLQLSKDVEGSLVVEDGLTQQDIASRVGASREMVSRVLKDLKTGGYIDIKDRVITIREKLPHSW